MIELIEYNFRLAEVTEDLNEKIILFLENYLMILGYLSAQNDDYYFYYYKDTKMDELEEKIKKLLNTDLNILNNDRNSFISFNLFLKRIDNEVIFNKYIINDYFMKGYNHYLLVRDNRNPLDFILGSKQNLEYKLRSYI